MDILSLPVWTSVLAVGLARDCYVPVHQSGWPHPLGSSLQTIGDQQALVAEAAAAAGVAILQAALNFDMP